MADIFKKIFLLLSATACTFLIYQPDKYLYGHPDQFNIKFIAFNFFSKDKTKLSAWHLFSKEEGPRNLVVFFHGNAQNLTAHFMNLAWITEDHYDLLIFDYRGYGLSDGKPEPQGVAEDGLAFLNESFDRYKKNKYKKLIIYTQSLGGAVALKALEDFKYKDAISLLVLDSTFLSPREVAREKTNRLFEKLISNDFTAHPSLSHITMPVLSIHSKNDPVIAYKLGLDLFEKIQKAKSKNFWTLDTPGHGDVFFSDKSYRDKFLNYVKNI